MYSAQILYLYLLALTLAFLEVQIEGEHGWAVKLPCWRPTGKWYARFYTKVMSGKEMTGYHVAVFLFAFLVMHLPYAWGMPWSIGVELTTFSQFFMFVVVWDFLWFVINPHYGIRKFHPGCVVWHKIWVGPAPIDYWGAILFSFIFAYVASRGAAPWSWFFMFATFIDLILLTLAIVWLVRRRK